MNTTTRNVETCENCKFFRNGTCYRMPPVWTSEPSDANPDYCTSNSCFNRPNVKPDDFCGEWKAIPDNRKE